MNLVEYTRFMTCIQINTPDQLLIIMERRQEIWFSGALMEDERQGCQDVYGQAKLDVDQPAEPWL